MKTKYFTELNSFISCNNLNISDSVLKQLTEYANLLVLKNDVVNLISRKDVDNVIENHIFHSILVYKYFPDKVITCLDFGTGGGLPGLPLSILCPEINFVLLDSIKKKINSVNEFISELNLLNCNTECERIESNYIQEKYSSYFDLIVSRATVKLKDLCELNFNLIKNHGWIISIKGGILANEIDEAKECFNKNIRLIKIVNLFYKPTNTKNEKDKKLIILEIKK